MTTYRVIAGQWFPSSPPKGEEALFERFTDRARRIVILAQEEARMLKHDYIGTEHLLLGMSREGEGVAALALAAHDISGDFIESSVVTIIGQGMQSPAGHIPFTPRAKKVLELSLREALQFGHNYIGTEHILLGLIREGEGVAAQIIAQRQVELTQLRQTVIQILSGYQGLPDREKLQSLRDRQQQERDELAQRHVQEREELHGEGVPASGSVEVPELSDPLDIAKMRTEMNDALSRDFGDLVARVESYRQRLDMLIEQNAAWTRYLEQLPPQVVKPKLTDTDLSELLTVLVFFRQQSALLMDLGSQWREALTPWIDKLADITPMKPESDDPEVEEESDEGPHPAPE